MNEWKIITASEDERILKIPAYTGFERFWDALLAGWFLGGLGVIILHLPRAVLAVECAVGMGLLILRFFFDEYYVADTSRKVLSFRRGFGAFSMSGKHYPFEELAALVIEKSTYRHPKYETVEGERHQVVLVTKANEKIPLLSSLLYTGVAPRIDARKLAPILGLELVEGDLDMKATFVPDVAGVPRIAWRDAT